MENNKYDHEVLVKAINFAAVNHSGDFRKGTEIPYIIHPMEAAVIVATMTNDPEVIAAAILHDVVEDTSVVIDNLRKEFNERICNLVSEESEDKRENLPAKDTWLIRKEETVKKIE